MNKAHGDPPQSQLQGKCIPGKKVLLSTECKGKQNALQITPNKQTGPGVKHDLYSPMVQSHMYYNALAADGQLGNVPFSSRTQLQASAPGGEQQFLGSHPPRENSGPKLINAQEHEKQRR